MKNWHANRLGWIGLLLLWAALTCQAGPSLQEASSTSSTAPLDAQQIRDSISKYEALSREQPDSAEVWSNLGVFHAMAGECRQALPALEHAERLNSKLFNPWFFSAYCLSALHQDRRALDSLQRALSLNPKDANAWLLKAQVSRDLGDLEVALEAAVRAQAIASSNPESYYFAGKVALELTTKFYERVASPGPESEFYSLFLDGQRNAAQGVFDLAQERYQNALKISPNRPDLQFAAGSASLESGSYAEAENSFRHCLENSDSAWARLRLTIALCKESKQPEAQTLLGSVSPGELVMPGEYNDFLICAFLLNMPEVAGRVLTQGQAKFPSDGQLKVWSERLDSWAAISSQAGQDSLKLEGLSGVGLSLRFYLSTRHVKEDEFKSLFPSSAAYLSFRSDFLSGRWMPAAGRIVPILKTEKRASSPGKAFAMGEILQSLSYGLSEQLGEEFPDSIPAMTLAAENLSTMGEPQRALEIFQSIVKRDGASPPILREMARIYWADHKWDEALEILQPLSQMDPEDAIIFVNIGRIYTFKQEPESAAKAFEQAIRVDSKMSEAHFGLGQILRKQGNLEGALHESRIASELDPLNPKPHYELSQIYAKLGDREHASREMVSFQHLQTIAGAEARQSNKMLVPLE
ncbi:MAG TPA: tetratricopeptide repeat protein [Terriglobia bacterium]|nr:tetratricopeptide repeat protein [Terriglobia bacterium]